MADPKPRREAAEGTSPARPCLRPAASRTARNEGPGVEDTHLRCLLWWPWLGDRVSQTMLREGSDTKNKTGLQLGTKPKSRHTEGGGPQRRARRGLHTSSVTLGVNQEGPARGVGLLDVWDTLEFTQSWLHRSYYYST